MGSSPMGRWRREDEEDEKMMTERNGKEETPKLLRIDAAWDNDRFLAEAETLTEDGETRYALVSDEGGERLYRIMTESLYDAVFCRTDGFMPGPEHVTACYGSLREAREAGTGWLMIFGRLDDVADEKDRLLDYRWQPED